MTKWRQGDLRAATPLFDEALNAARRAVPEKDPRPDLVANRAWWRDQFAAAIKAQGKFDEALVLYRESLKERKNLAAREGATEADEANLASSYIDLGDALADSGDLLGALKYYKDSLEIAKKLYQAKQSDCDRRHSLSQSYDRGVYAGTAAVARRNQPRRLRDRRLSPFAARIVCKGHGQIRIVL